MDYQRTEWLPQLSPCSQAFAIDRESIEKKTGKLSKETVYGITSRTRDKADAERILKTNRGHWSIESSCHYIIDWNHDEDCGRIKTAMTLKTLPA